ncbi:unannotated protein [freshwater metagenome]|uniref:Unannotated protein n=1 Tax=freshwater metagenome TaxID=449393 RepID=A0A6J7RUN7_9ZZZZ
MTVRLTTEVSTTAGRISFQHDAQILLVSASPSMMNEWHMTTA